MNALVEPLPFVPATWMALSFSKSEGFTDVSEVRNGYRWELDAHLITYPSTPIDHLWDCVLVHSFPGLANCIYYGEVRLQSV